VRRDAFIVEGCARGTLSLEGPLVDLHVAREHFLAEAIHEEAGLPIQVAAVYRRDEVAEKPDRDRRFEKHRRLAGRDLACTQPCRGALRGIAAERLGLGDLARHARSRIPVVALHEALLLGDHGAREVMTRPGKAASESKAIGKHELRLLRRNRGALGVLDDGRGGERRILAALGECDRFLGAQGPRME
jgi:hypothetical protein